MFNKSLAISSWSRSWQSILSLPLQDFRGWLQLSTPPHPTVPSLKATTAHSIFLFWVLSRVLPGMASAQMKQHHVHPNPSFPTGLQLQGGFVPPGCLWFLCFTVLVSSIPSYCKQSLREAARAGVSVQGGSAEFGTYRQGGLRKRTEQAWSCASLLHQGFVLHLATPPWGIPGTGVITFYPASSHFLPSMEMDAEDFKNLKGSGQLSKDAHLGSFPLIRAAQSKRCSKNIDPMQREIGLKNLEKQNHPPNPTSQSINQPTKNHSLHFHSSSFSDLRKILKADFPRAVISVNLNHK